MQSVIQQLENVVSKAGELAESKAELWKLKTAGKFSETISSLIVVMTIVLCVAAAFTILSIGAAIWIGSRLGQPSHGFFIVGGFYTVAGFVIYLFRHKWIKTPLSNIIIDKLVK